MLLVSSGNHDGITIDFKKNVKNPGEYFLIITSNYCIDDIFDSTNAEAIKRRFSLVCFDNMIERGIEFDKTILMKKKFEMEHEEEQRAIEEDHRSWFCRTTSESMDDSVLSSHEVSHE